MSPKAWGIAAALAILALIVPAIAAQQQPGTQLSSDGSGSEAIYRQAALHTRIELIPSHQVVAPGQSFHLAVVVHIDPGYWLYGPAPGGRLVQPRPLRVSAEMGNDLQAGEALYPPARLHGAGEGEVYDEHYVYENTAILYVPISVASDAAPGAATVQVRLRGQLCDPQRCLELLLTGQTTITIGAAGQANPAFPAIAPGPSAPQPAATWQARLVGPATRPAEAAPGVTAGTWAILLGALVAGVWLNITPCVLPVLPLKIVSLLQQARGSRRRSVTLGLAYAGGIFLFFAAIGAASAAVRVMTGAVLNLNEPFQYPAGIIAMALLLVLVALGLFDVFTISLGGALAARQPRAGHAAALSAGLLTALLATPCSGPVILGVLGYAQTPPAWVSAAVFGLMGLGMAAPHAVLAGFPRLLEKLPKPGPWTEHLKRLLGFLLLAVAAWLISTLGEARWMWRVTAYAVLGSLLVWIAARWVTVQTAPAPRRAVRALALLAALGAGLWLLPAPQRPPIDWIEYQPAGLAAAREQGKVVMLKFTAEWCLNCHILDRRVYHTEPVVAAVRQRGVVAVRGDVTRKGPATRLMAELGEGGPPVTIIWGPGVPEPIHLGGMHSVAELLAALDRAAGGKT